MNTTSSKSSSKLERKIIEKNRRTQMKFLHSQLNSLVNQDASSSSREPLSLPDQIDKATEYVKKLKENVANLKRQKDNLTASNGSYNRESSSRCSRSKSYRFNSGVEIEIYEKGNAIEVILVTGLECQFVFTEALRIIHDEHAEIVNASYSVNGNIVFHTIHAQIKEDSRSHGVARITQRLKMFAL